MRVISFRSFFFTTSRKLQLRSHRKATHPLKTVERRRRKEGRKAGRRNCNAQ